MTLTFKPLRGGQGSAPPTRGKPRCARWGFRNAHDNYESLWWPTPGSSEGEMAIRRRYSKLSCHRAIAAGGQTCLWQVLRLSDVPTHQFPGIYEWIMGFPANWTLPPGTTPKES